MKSFINYIKNLFLKKEVSFQDNQHSETNNYLKGISELNTTAAEKIEILIANKLNLSKVDISDNMHICIDLGGDELDVLELLMEIETVFKIKIQDGAFRLTIGELKNYVEKKLNNPGYIILEEKILYNEKGWFGLEKMLYEENLYGRSIAIKELLKDRYIILEDEFGNPFKEIINYTLLYFSNKKFSNNEELLNIIQGHFPIMCNYLIKQLKVINSNLLLQADFNNDVNFNFDEQKGYEEFLNFCYKLFTESYPEKILRDSAITNSFKHSGHNLIVYIEHQKRITANNSHKQ